MKFYIHINNYILIRNSSIYVYLNLLILFWMKYENLWLTLINASSWLKDQSVQFNANLTIQCFLISPINEQFYLVKFKLDKNLNKTVKCTPNFFYKQKCFDMLFRQWDMRKFLITDVPCAINWYFNCRLNLSVIYEIKETPKIMKNDERMLTKTFT